MRVFCLIWMIFAVSSVADATPIAVKLLRDSPDNIRLQVGEAYPQPLRYRVVREDDGQPVAGIAVQVGQPCFGDFGGCPSLPYFIDLILGISPGPVNSKTFRSDCNGLVTTDVYYAGDQPNTTTTSAVILLEQGPGISLVANPVETRTQVTTVIQTISAPPAPDPLVAYPREFCGVTDPANKCTTRLLTHGFEAGLCGAPTP